MFLGVAVAGGSALIILPTGFLAGAAMVVGGVIMLIAGLKPEARW
jgi:hypothetical protein